MVATITFRLRSSNHVGIIDVPRRLMSCREIKEAIATKLSGSPEEIDIFVSGTSDYLHPEEELPAYTVVEVVRHVASGRPPPRREREAPASNNPPCQRALSRMGTKEGDASASLTEEERLAQLSEAVAAETGIDEVGGWRTRQARNRLMENAMGGREDSFRPPPPGYICHNCGKRGHLIQHCPAARGAKGLKVLSLPTGIPETMLVECTMDDPAAKFVTRDGRLVKRRLDNSSFTGVVTTAADMADVPKKSDTNLKSGTNGHSKDPVDGADVKPTEESKLLCGWDKVLAKNAMKAICCSTLFCETCFNQKVEELISRDETEGEPLLCPGCNKPLSVCDVTAAVEERKIIGSLHSRKRGRE
ncbi:nucleic acid binding protein [Trypanosoma rangeli]|uniref:Nucleic acid binding protein n=1 Tax=Trypanosoma rangeli TaxID=5698 RepID=A0A3S5ISL5_TRYRA|nr:nucleic acid binding protein [Trypanosoma rangeli]RNF12037.1 nucleic acid binding protein [Trypanosoma rangeli]|eukprot:RNF12037.1 nucleic acid binding protein [Trypanosoma rangeli]